MDTGDLAIVFIFFILFTILYALIKKGLKIAIFVFLFWFALILILAPSGPY